MLTWQRVRLILGGISIVVHDIPDPLGQRVIESMSTCWGNVGPVAEHTADKFTFSGRSVLL